MNKRNEGGFSLIELLLVVAIICIVAAIAVPAFQKGLWAAENGRAVATMRTINSTQVAFYSQNNRFGRLKELQPMVGNGLGTTVGEKVVRGGYLFEMDPVLPSDEELKTEFSVSATRSITGDTTYMYKLTHTGEIEQILP